MNEIKLTLKRLQKIQPGQKILYHQGLLMLDRKLAQTWRDEKNVQVIDDLGCLAWDMFERGLVTLIQERQADDTFKYIAIGKGKIRK